MNGLAEVIPIASRRAHRKNGTPPPQVTERLLSPQKRRRRVLGFCAVMLGFVLVLIVLDRTVLPHAHASVPPPLSTEVRQGLYQRALDDVAAACGLPQAQTGLLRRHCLDQARFLQQLPECSDDCARLAQDLLNSR